LVSGFDLDKPTLDFGKQGSLAWFYHRYKTAMRFGSRQIKGVQNLCRHFGWIFAQLHVCNLDRRAS
jgi:hypothetical protein